MNENSITEEQWTTCNVGMDLAGTAVEMSMTVPAGLVKPARLLPIFQQISSGFVDVAVNAVQASGKSISCKAGCGACCNQLVPISSIEAHSILELVDALPEPRKSEVLARFAAARQKFADAGLLDKLQQPENYPLDDLTKLGMEYFHQGVPCPFLENQSCSIHPNRPMICREYLVTSDPEFCANPTAETIDAVGIPAKVAMAICKLSTPPGAKMIRWVPLSLAPDWAHDHPDDLGSRPGPELLRDLFEALRGQKPEPVDNADVTGSA